VLVMKKAGRRAGLSSLCNSIMKIWILRFSLVLIILPLVFGFWIVQVAGFQQAQLMTNESVIKLVKGGFKEKSIISIVKARPCKYDLWPEKMVELKRAGVSEKIILAMVSRQESANFDEGWTDDPFFEDSDIKLDKKEKSNDGSSMDVFGSGSGSKSNSRNTIVGGGSQDNIETSGDATVRIIRRPSSESGGSASPKLERTPTLKNEDVIQLVEAGFTEGTIIRRIDGSPVEFDLSTKAITELRKRQVSEKIIAAMRSAMAEDPSPVSR
jgi:hypothetical protein